MPRFTGIDKSGQPIGTIFKFSQSTLPYGWLSCDGSSQSTTTYAALFSVIGFTYGGSGGSFNLPDFRGRSPMGDGTGSGLTARTIGDKPGSETQATSVSVATQPTFTVDTHTHYVTSSVSVSAHGITQPTFTVDAHNHGPGSLCTQLDFISASNKVVANNFNSGVSWTATNKLTGTWGGDSTSTSGAIAIQGLTNTSTSTTTRTTDVSITNNHSVSNPAVTSASASINTTTRTNDVALSNPAVNTIHPTLVVKFGIAYI